MKKFLKHANRGIIVSVIIIMGILTYLTATAVSQGREKPAIETVCREYIAAEIQFSLLPEQYRTLESDMTEEQFEAYLQKLETTLLPFYIDNDRIREIAYEQLSNYLESQLMNQAPVLSYEKTILSFDSFIFDGSQVTVELTTQSTIELPENKNFGEPGGRIAGETTDHIVLEKVSNQWLVVYASLSQPHRSHRY